MRRSSGLLVAAAAVVAASVVGVSAAERVPRTLQAEPCPDGFRREREPTVGLERAQTEFQRPASPERQAEHEREEREREAAGGGPGKVECVPVKKPESFRELALFAGLRDSRSTAPATDLRAGALRAALAARGRMGSVPGSAGEWIHLSDQPLEMDVIGYDEINSIGFGEVAGRISDFAHVPGTDTIYAAVGNGGVWRSTDLGGSWQSIGDELPTQVVGTVGYTTAGGGTIVTVTGDSALGRYSVTGIGAYWSADEGETWHRVDGIPDGAVGFGVAADPTAPSEVYAATSVGLFRSTDAGRSFTNVVLPTGDCAGGSQDSGCYLANVVTDVVVTAPGGATAHPGGVVVAAVGWRANAEPDADGRPQSAGNGIYRSTTGTPGSFARLTTTGFAPQNRIGRTELAAATGADQDHEFVYAIVQDAVVYNGGVPVLDADDPTGLAPIVASSVFNGLYVTGDLGDTWAQIASPQQVALPTTGTALGVNALIGYAPGVQAWFNEQVAVDPSITAADGVPTRLVFGLEEVFENDLAGVVPLDGSLPVSWRVIGRYYAGTSCQGAGIPLLVVCPTNRPPNASTTTHPDQHAALFVEDGDDLVLLVGNDGGVFRQRIDPVDDFSNTGWGRGSNDGFDTLMYYDVAMARDGVAYGGLQDNGHARIQPDGRQIGTFGGDGFDAAVHPADSDIAYEEYVSGVMSVTTDGGKSWRSIDPGLTSALFRTPFVMDPLDGNHLVIGGRDLVETLWGPETASTDEQQWVTVFDLGTQGSPGDAEAQSSDDDADNQMSAVDLRGDAIYLGFCGKCDVLTQGVPFTRGIATNVGGSEEPEAATTRGWHIAAAKGLPRRIVTGVHIDPFNPETVYVTLAGYGRRWLPPGAIGDDVAGVGAGHVFKSTDAGETFHDISGDLPDMPYNAIISRGGQLLVASDVGAFLSSDLEGSAWQPLDGLPNVQVTALELKPGDDRTLVAATFGRGPWVYRFAGSPIPHPDQPGTDGELPATGTDPQIPLVALAVLGLVVLAGVRLSRT